MARHKLGAPLASEPPILAAWKTLCSSTWSSISSGWRATPIGQPGQTKRRELAGVFILNTHLRSTPSPKPGRVFKMNRSRPRDPSGSCPPIACCSALPCSAGASANLHANSDAARPACGDGRTGSPSFQKTRRPGWKTWWPSTGLTQLRKSGTRPQPFLKDQLQVSRETWAKSAYEACTIVLAEEPSLLLNFASNCPTVQPVMLLLARAVAETKLLNGADGSAVAMFAPGLGPNTHAP